MSVYLLENGKLFTHLSGFAMEIVWKTRQPNHNSFSIVKSGLPDMTPRNIIGPQLRKLRDQKGMSQQTLAELLQRKGWDVSRGMIARIEGQVRWISDFELLFLSEVLCVSPDWFLKCPGNSKLAVRLVSDLQWGNS